MPTRSELADLLAIPASDVFAPCADNHAITQLFVAVARDHEIFALWDVLREGLGRGWSAYYTAARSDRGFRIGLRPLGRRAEFLAAKLHVTAQGAKLSSSRPFGALNRRPLLERDRQRSAALRGFLAALPQTRRTGPFLGVATGYDHAQALSAAADLLPRRHPPC
jgi:hypothetical protein